MGRERWKEGKEGKKGKEGKGRKETEGGKEGRKEASKEARKQRSKEARKQGSKEARKQSKEARERFAVFTSKVLHSSPSHAGGLGVCIFCWLGDLYDSTRLSAFSAVVYVTEFMRIFMYFHVSTFLRCKSGILQPFLHRSLLLDNGA